MPTNHEAVAALPISSAASQTLVRNLLVRRLAYVAGTAAEVQDLVAVDPTTGVVIVVITLLGRNYLYDAADTTSAHDGVTVLVSSDGKRYKLASNSEVLVYSVLDRTSTPPGSPTISNAYLITAAPTGAWAGHADHIGVFTSRGWEFIVPAVGRSIYVQDEDAYYRKKADGSITIGLGVNAVGVESILPSHILGGGARVNWPVENQTTDTPPAVVNGRAYIVGSSPTGVWAGHAGKIAHGEAGAWVIYAPQEGWLAYDKNDNALYSHDGSAWASKSGRFRIAVNNFTSSGTFNKSARCIGILVEVIGGGGGGGSGGTSGGSSSFGGYCSATGGAAGTGSGGGAAGTGSGGDVNEDGQDGVFLNATLTTVSLNGGQAPGAGQRGRGGKSTGNSVGSGGGGGRARSWIGATALTASVVVTVGNGGTAGSNGTAGTGGQVHILEFIET